MLDYSQKKKMAMSLNWIRSARIISPNSAFNFGNLSIPGLHLPIKSNHWDFDYSIWLWLITNMTTKTNCAYIRNNKIFFLWKNKTLLSISFLSNEWDIFLECNYCIFLWKRRFSLCLKDHEKQKNKKPSVIEKRTLRN